MGGDSTSGAKPIIVLLLMAVLILLIYSNTFHAEWHFDDKPVILENERLKIDNLRPSTLLKTFFAKQQGKQNTFYRPLPSLSFALNWYVGQDRPFGFHLVNIVIHLLTAFFLYLSVQTLLQTPRMEQQYRAGDAHFIAVLSAVLWAINPVQIQAVTYIVQRMASMATMFTIMAIYLYLKGRRHHLPKKQVLYYAACFLCALSALMSKENAILIIPSLLLVEMIFFQYADLSKNIKAHPLITAAILAVGILLGFLIFKWFFLDFISRGYTTRSFTLWERLLTQPRVLIHYLSQMFYPLPSRLSISHDFIVSTSLIAPWSTLFSILFVLFSIGMAVAAMGKWPLVAFGVCYFFLNHVIESTIFPLELIFEHRNYLPSLFLFMSIAAGITYLINYYTLKNRSMVLILISFVTLVIMGWGCFTYIRNHAWRTETTLWRDAMLKAPLDARPAWNVAINIAWDKHVTQRQLDTALVLFEKALSMNQAREVYDSLILRNIGLIHLRRGEIELAIDAFKRSLAIHPYFNEVLFDLASVHMRTGNWDAALEQLEMLLPAARDGKAPDYYKMKGYILLWQNRPETALNYFRKALAADPNNSDLLMNTGIALDRLNKHTNAGLFLQKARKASPNKLRYHCALIENSARAGDMKKARMHARRMLATFSLGSVFNGLESMRDNFRTAPVELALIVPIVKKEADKMLEELDAQLRW